MRINSRRTWSIFAVVTAVTASIAVTTSPAAAQQEAAPVISSELARTFELSDGVIGRPVKLAAAPDGRQLYLVDAAQPARATLVTFDEHAQGSVPLPPELVGTDMTYDPRARSLAPVEVDGSRITLPGRSIDVGRFGLAHPTGVAIDPLSGAWYVGAPEQQQVLVIDSNGELIRTLDLSSAGVGRITSLAVALTGDQTDAPDQLSLYVLDEQEAGGTTVLREFSTTEPLAESLLSPMEQNAALAAPDVTGTLIQMIAGTSFSPNSPDSSGIAWMSAKNQLLLSDSEVNEYSYYDDTNLWNLTTAGDLVSTGNTLAWSKEPTGVTVDTAENRSFTTDDNAQRITEVDLGPDGLAGTSDDTVVRFFSTVPYGNTDPEDVAYDTTRGWLHVSDGSNREVFSIDPGANGIFEGGGDDIITNWDTYVDGVNDPEGIAYHAANDTLTVVDYSTGDLAAVEYAALGGALREISLAESNALHPAGVTWAPASNGSGLNLWVVDRGIDGSSPRDGKLFELAIPPLGAVQPDVHVPVSVDVGVAAVGFSGTVSVTVSNVGSSDLTVSATGVAGVDAAAFAVTAGGAPFVVPAGGSRQVEVTFSPSEVRSYSASLVIDSDDPDEASVSVALSGTGVAEPTGSVSVGATYQGGSSGLASVSTATPVNVGSPGRVFVAYVSTKSFTSVTGVSGLGGSWSLVASLCAGRSQTGMSVFVTTSASSSSVVTASLASAQSNAVIAVVEYDGVDLAAPIGAVVAKNTNGVNGGCSGGVDSASYSVPLTTTSPSSLVSSAVAIRNKSHTAGSGFTERLEASAGNGGSAAALAIQEQTPASAGALTVTGAISGNVDWSVIAIEIRAAG